MFLISLFAREQKEGKSSDLQSFRNWFSSSSVCNFFSSDGETRLQNREIVAGLWFQPECHGGIVLCNHFVEKAFGLHGEALSPCATVYMPAPSALLPGVSSQTQLPHDAVEWLPDIVLHGSWGFDELAVKHGGTRAALCEITKRDTPEGLCFKQKQATGVWVSLPLVNTSLRRTRSHLFPTRMIGVCRAGQKRRRVILSSEALRNEARSVMEYNSK